MNAATLIIIAAIIAAVVFALRTMKKNNGHACSGCKGCDHCCSYDKCNNSKA